MALGPLQIFLPSWSNMKRVHPSRAERFNATLRREVEIHPQPPPLMTPENVAVKRHPSAKAWADMIKHGAGMKSWSPTKGAVSGSSLLECTKRLYMRRVKTTIPVSAKAVPKGKKRVAATDWPAASNVAYDCAISPNNTKHPTVPESCAIVQSKCGRKRRFSCTPMVL